VVDVIRERIEEDIEPVIAALIDALTADRGVVVGQGESASVERVPDHDARIKAARELLDGRMDGRAWRSSTPAPRAARSSSRAPPGSTCAGCPTAS
jgi:hypothetical protein